MNPLQDKHFTLPAADLIDLVHDARAHTLALVADLDEDQFNVPQRLPEQRRPPPCCMP